MSAVRDSDRADRVRGREGARHPAPCASRFGVDCQSMPTSHAAVRHRVSWGKARRAEHAFLRDWDGQRPRRRPRYLGTDETHRGKAQKFYTVLSDLVHGEVIGLAKDRTAESLVGLLTTSLDARQRAAVDAVCTDMHRPYVNAVARELPEAEIVFDKFHVLQRIGRAGRCAPEGVLSRRRGDAGVRPREALAALASVEDGARVE